MKEPMDHQRRLAAVLIADIAGYTRLVEQDTEGTVTAWQAARDGVIKPLVEKDSGIIIKFTGDGFLVEFPAIQNAVNCAISMQEELKSSPLKFRMGINIGDIMDDGGDIHGEGVNIAARLEALATPGGICMSGDVYNHVRNRIDANYVDMGEQQVKHVTQPVRVYAIGGDEPIEVVPLESTSPQQDNPSIAVLPFDSYSNDSDHDYLSEGLTEDLITDLSKLSGLFVVARNSSSAYKDQPVDIRTVAENLGVRYVIEGSIRKMGERIRINVQLIDASTGGHIWADRYDGLLSDAFELQDDVCAKVVSALSVQLTYQEQQELQTVHTRNLEAYELFVRARSTPFPPVPERINNAKHMFEQVIEMDPDFAGGYAGASAMLSFQAMWNHEDMSEAINQALVLAKKAIDVDETFAWSHTALGMSLLHHHQYSDALAASQKAIARQPNDADAYGYLSLILGLDGQYKEALLAIDKALQLDPVFFNGPYLNERAIINLLARDYDASINDLRKNMDRNGPVGPPVLALGAAACIGAGHPSDATKLVERLKENFSTFTTENWNFLSLVRSDEVRQNLTGLMNEAGVPG